MAIIRKDSDTEGKIKIYLRRAEEPNEKRNINNSINMVGLKSSVDEINQYNLIVSDGWVGFSGKFLLQEY